MYVLISKLLKYLFNLSEEVLWICRMVLMVNLLDLENIISKYFLKNCLSYQHFIICKQHALWYLILYIFFISSITKKNKWGLKTEPWFIPTLILRSSVSQLHCFFIVYYIHILGYIVRLYGCSMYYIDPEPTFIYYKNVFINYGKL